MEEPALRLPPLPPRDSPQRELVDSFRGPTKRSNWVVPGLLLAGNRGSLGTEDGMRAIVGAGVSCIVCLQSRQETKAAVPYRRRAEAFRRGIAFRELPTPDQNVTADEQVEILLEDLLGLLAEGAVLYVHCKGGHGRTGVVCALLLGRLYGVGAPEAMARVQLYHDTRQEPIFAAEGYEERDDGGGCIVLFPAQKEQVLRLLPDPEGGVPGEPADLARASSSTYGPGASGYEEATMVEWETSYKAAVAAMRAAANIHKKRGDEAAKAEEWRRAVMLSREAAQVRPDFARGHLLLSRALRFLKEHAEAAEALRRGLAECPENGELLGELQKLEGASPAPAPEAEKGASPAPAPEAENRRGHH